jgi:two-component system OmpR family response regulator
MSSDTVPLHARRWTARRIGTPDLPLQVLVVDDDENAAAALADRFHIVASGSHAVASGAEAIAIGTRWLPHVILMDVSMPECNGIQAARALRQAPCTAGIAIIARTALDETEVRRHLAEAEFDGYFQKGQPVDRLVALIASF